MSLVVLAPPQLAMEVWIAPFASQQRPTTGVGMSPHSIGRKTRKNSAANQWKLEIFSTQSHQMEPVFVETSNLKLKCQFLAIDAHTHHVTNKQNCHTRCNGPLSHIQIWTNRWDLHNGRSQRESGRTGYTISNSNWWQCCSLYGVSRQSQPTR